MTHPLNDWGGHLQSELEKAERDLADQERLKLKSAYGEPLAPEGSAQIEIDRLRGVRDMRKKILDDWRAIPSNAFPTAITQEERAKQGILPTR